MQKNKERARSFIYTDVIKRMSQRCQLLSKWSACMVVVDKSVSE